MKRIFVLVFSVLLAFTPSKPTAETVLSKDVDSFLAAANRELAKKSYASFLTLMNVQPSQRAAVEATASLLRSHFGSGAGPRLSVLFRRDSGDEGVQLVAVIWREDKYLYVSITGHVRPDGFAVVHFGLEGNYSALTEKYL